MPPEPGPPPALARFFRAFVPMLEHRATATEVERKVGVSPSGTRRLDFYGVLALRNRFIALRNVCPALRHAALSLEPPVWVDLVTSYSRRRLPRHSDPNRFADELSDYLAERRGGGWAVPDYLEEIADFEFTEWAVGVCAFEPTVDDPGLDRTIHVRRYTHDIPGFVASFRAGGATLAPRAESCTVLIYRDQQTALPRTFLPTPLGLAALGRRAGRSLPLGNTSEEAYAAAERELERHGVLPLREARPAEADPRRG